jgi:hypothetical protein
VIFTNSLFYESNNPCYIPIVLVTAVSCSNEPVEQKKEVIVVPKKEEKKPTVVVEKEPSTSIDIGKSGVKVKSKKVKVNIKPN